MFKFILSFLGFLVIPLQGFASAVTLSGLGSIEQPFLIGSRSDFDQIRLAPDAHFQITNNIDFEGVIWQPISNVFSGILDGNGYSIQNFYTNDSFGTHSAIFSSIQDAVIRNLSVHGSAEAHEAGRNVALLTGHSLRSVFESVHVFGTVYHHWSDPAFVTEWVGLISGRSANDHFIRCSATGSASGRVYVGGITGGMSSGVVDECYANVIIEVRRFHSGGALIGDIFGGSVIRNSFASGVVTGASGVNELGGLIGRLRQTSRVSQVYADVRVEGDGDNLGGLIGLNEVGDFFRPITDAFWSNYRAGIDTSSGGTNLGAGANLKVRALFAGFDFGGIWVFPENNSDFYGPYLQGNPPPEFFGSVVNDWLVTHGIPHLGNGEIPINFKVGLLPQVSASSLIELQPTRNGRMISVFAPRRYPLQNFDFIVEASDSLAPDSWVTVSPASGQWPLDSQKGRPLFRSFIAALIPGIGETAPVFFRLRVIENE